MAPRTAKATPAKATDADVMAPEANVVTLVSGTQLEVVPLRTRQFFKLMRIITRGAGEAITQLRLDPESSDMEFAAKLIGTIGFAIPEAEEETIDFIQAMCKPVGLIERNASQLNKQDRERNETLWIQLVSELENPELDDTLTIVEAVVNRETPNLKALGKRLVSMFELAKKTGQMPKSKD